LGSFLLTLLLRGAAPNLPAQGCIVVHDPDTDAALGCADRGSDAGGSSADHENIEPSLQVFTQSVLTSIPDSHKV
jgi:hypothetical protein